MFFSLNLLFDAVLVVVAAFRKVATSLVVNRTGELKNVIFSRREIACRGYYAFGSPRFLAENSMKITFTILKEGVSFFTDTFSRQGLNRVEGERERQKDIINLQHFSTGGG